MRKKVPATNPAEGKWTREEEAAFQAKADLLHKEYLERLNARFPEGLPFPPLFDLEYFVDSYEMMATNGYGPHVSKRDIELLQRTTAGLRKASKLFYEKIKSVTDPETQAAIACAVEDIFRHSRELGGFSRFLPDFQRQWMDAKRAQNARLAKMPAIERRRAIIKARYKPDDLTDSDKFAESIKPEVDKELARVGLGPTSARTIRRDIKAILAGHSDRMRKK